MPGAASHQQSLLGLLGDGACRRIDDLAALTGDRGLTRRQVCDAAAGLIERGYLERREIGCYQLTEAGRAAQAAGEVLTSGPRGPMARQHPVAGSLRAKLWRAARLRRKFTIGDLLRLACAGDERDAKGNAARYLRLLAQGGYLTPLARVEDGKPTSNGLPRYALVRDTGPLPPMVRTRTKPVEIFDPNTQEVFVCTRGQP